MVEADHSRPVWAEPWCKDASHLLLFLLCPCLSGFCPPIPTYMFHAINIVVVYNFGVHFEQNSSITAERCELRFWREAIYANAQTHPHAQGTRQAQT